LALSSADDRLHTQIFLLLIHAHLRLFQVSPRRYYSTDGQEFWPSRPPLNNKRFLEKVRSTWLEKENFRDLEFHLDSKPSLASEFRFWSSVEFNSTEELLAKIQHFQNYFNLSRPSKFRGNQTPLQIAQSDKIIRALGLEIGEGLFTKFPVLVLDELVDEYLKFVADY
jgi:hypothetical protein